MALNIRDAQSSLMTGQAKAQRIMSDITQQFYQPEIDTQVAMLYHTLPPAVKDQLRQMVPDAMADLEKRYGHG